MKNNENIVYKMVGVLVVVIIILFFTFYSLRYQDSRDEYFGHLPEFVDSFNTGDVLMMNGDSIYDNYNVICYWLMQVLQYNVIGDFTTHTGVVIVHDKPYVYHMTAYPRWDDYRNMYVYNGPVYQEITKFIDQYPGYITIYKNTRENTRENNNIKYSINPLNWLIDLNFKTNLFTKENELYCYEFTAYTLGIQYRNISSGELIGELHEHGYSGPYLCDNLYRHLAYLFK